MLRQSIVSTEDTTPEPDPNRCDRCEHPEGHCDCRCCNEPTIIGWDMGSPEGDRTVSPQCDHCHKNLDDYWVVADEGFYCSKACAENSAESQGMARAAADLR